MHKFQDSRRRYIYAVAADSWHQPKENANGQVIWNYRMKTKQEEENVSVIMCEVSTLIRAIYLATK